MSRIKASIIVMKLLRRRGENRCRGHVGGIKAKACLARRHAGIAFAGGGGGKRSAHFGERRLAAKCAAEQWRAARYRCHARKTVGTASAARVIGAHINVQPLMSIDRQA